MSVSFKSGVTSANVNAALMSRTVNTDTVGQVDLLNLDAASGGTVSNIQRCLNSYASFIGATTSLAFDDTPTWGSNELGTATDTLKARIEAIDAEFADLRPYIIDATSTERGLVSVNAQSLSGLKTFINGADIESSASISGTLDYLSEEDSTTTGANQTLGTPTAVILRLTNASLSSIDGITAPTTNQVLTIVNDTGGAVTFNNALGTAANQIITGSDNDLEIIDGASVSLFYDLDGTKWRITGGAGSSANAPQTFTFDYTALQTGALVNTIEAFSLAGRSIIEYVGIKTTTAFAGTGITDLGLEIGLASDPDKYLESYDGIAPVGDSNSSFGSTFYGPESFASATSIKLKATAIGANLDQLSQGEVEIYVKRSLLP